jgi:hypothetical protein
VIQSHQPAVPAEPGEASQIQGVPSVIQVQELARFSGWPQPYRFFNRRDSFLVCEAVFESTSADVCLAQPVVGHERVFRPAHRKWISATYRRNDMVQRYKAIGSVLNKWYQVRSRYLPWPRQLMQPAIDMRTLSDVSAVVEAEWEKDWIDIGGEG